MARPSRNARIENVQSSACTVFATTRTSQGRALLQPDRNATLLIDVLRSYVAARKFRLHDIVVMPDHLPLLLTVGEGMTIEKAMRFVERGFSYRLRKEHGCAGRSGSAVSPSLESKMGKDSRGIGNVWR